MKGMSWAVLAGVVVGALGGLVAFAPAAWLANAVASASEQRLLLADARGSIWRGSAVLLLAGGTGSRDAVALPGRLSWEITWAGREVELRARHKCCLHENFHVLLRPGIGRLGLRLPALQGTVGQWPAAWLAGLGAPWNTLQLGGVLRLHSPGLSFESAQGRQAFSGHAELLLEDISSPLSTLPKLGSYRLAVAGQPDAGEHAALNLTTTRGPLLLSGSGQWSGAASGSRLRFRGEARAAPESESALNNLLNIIGRRQGELSILSIG